MDAAVFVYVIGSPNGLKKIGIARDPARRCAALNSAGLRKSRVLHSRLVPEGSARAVEGHAHFLLGSGHVRGEWFRASTQRAKEAVDASAAISGAGNQAKRTVGRTKQWHENINLTLPKGAKAEMDAVLEEGEDRLDLIREAISKEVKLRQRRERKAKDESNG